MTTNATAIWMPPDASYLNLSGNCTMVAEFAATFYTSLDIPLFNALIYLSVGFKKYWTQNNIQEQDMPNFTIGDILQWAFFDEFDSFIEELNKSLEYCRPEICKRLPWVGNADLSGRGMITSYWIQCALVTIFFAFHAAARFGWSPKPKTVSHRLLSTFQESTRPFLDTSMLFCMAVQSATIFVLSVNLQQKDLTPTITTVSSAFISIYTLFPPIVLHNCAAEHLRRRKGRRCVWALLAAMTAAVCGLYFSNPQSPWRRKTWKDIKVLTKNANTFEQLGDIMLREDPSHQRKWDAMCLAKEDALRANGAFVGTIGSLLFLLVLGLLFVRNILRIPMLNSERRPALQSLRKHWQFLSSILAFLAMWTSLAIFFWFRRVSNKSAGEKSGDREWGFGQIIAIATWMPVLLELLTILRKGTEKGLTGLLSDRYIVVRGPDHTDSKDSIYQELNSTDSWSGWGNRG
ncbi:hypothetical protein BS50DRAFT_625831 [Corynespora cassiicola Philippines]|uniref:Uncharacterized protein n=1 Tax=Corynespora cassiicola Philippines TaxID=1448308 RepID=A0A2T2N717_CORCC|nr:hypothetical protein BS50DRAFT_625831 [Corynespora cassiicola Philippines]